MKPPPHDTQRSEVSPDSPFHPYMPAIDGLRGIAILLVLWYHAPFLFRQLSQFSDEQSPWTSLGLFWVMSLGGWMGVDLFFVISGFLITLILLQVRRAHGSALPFWARRALKILPLAVLYLAALAGLVALGDPLHILPDFDAWAWYAFYLGNIHIALYGWQPLAIMILWSLAIEEQFYLVWPFLVRLCNARYVLSCSMGLIILAPVIRAAIFSAADYPATYVFSFCRVDALAFGAVIAVLYSAPERRQRLITSCKKLTVPALAIVMITVLMPFSPSSPPTRPWFFTVVWYSLLGASFAVLVVASLEMGGTINRLLASRILTFLGTRCYGLYIWHVVAAALTIALLKPWDLGFYSHMFLWCVVLVTIASGSWLLFEEPLLRLKRFVPYQGSPRAQAGFSSRLIPIPLRRYPSANKAG